MKQPIKPFADIRALAAKTRVLGHNITDLAITWEKFDIMRQTEEARILITGRKTGPLPTVLQVNKYLAKNGLPLIKIIEDEASENLSPAGSNTASRL